MNKWMSLAIISVLAGANATNAYFVYKYRTLSDEMMAELKRSEDIVKTCFDTSMKAVAIADAYEKKWKQCIGVKNE
jgi:nitrogen regulatory protein PII-like uncharacterized protein